MVSRWLSVVPWTILALGASFVLVGLLDSQHRWLTWLGVSGVLGVVLLVAVFRWGNGKLHRANGQPN